MKKKRIKVIYRKLDKEKVWGYSKGEGVIEMDNKLKGQKHLEILIHECIHELFPLEHEQDVERKAAIMARTAWHEGYRRTDNDLTQKLQDEISYKKQKK